MAAGSLRIFLLLVGMIEVGCGRPGAVWLLHFDAASFDPFAAGPLDEPGLEGGFTDPGDDAVTWENVGASCHSGTHST